MRRRIANMRGWNWPPLNRMQIRCCWGHEYINLHIMSTLDIWVDSRLTHLFPAPYSLLTFQGATCHRYRSTMSSISYIDHTQRSHSQGFAPVKPTVWTNPVSSLSTCRFWIIATQMLFECVLVPVPCIVLYLQDCVCVCVLLWSYLKAVNTTIAVMREMSDVA